jgi:hypothetical protein
MKPLSFLGSILASTVTSFPINTLRPLEPSFSPQPSYSSSMIPNYTYSPYPRSSKSVTSSMRHTPLVYSSHNTYKRELF